MDKNEARKRLRELSKQLNTKITDPTPPSTRVEYRLGGAVWIIRVDPQTSQSQTEGEDPEGGS